MIIGFSARKQGGKTTATDALRKRLGSLSHSVLSFADPLKRIVLNCFVPKEWDLLIGDLDEDSVKEMVTPCGKTIRQLLQIVGTDWFRRTDPDVWVRAAGSLIQFDNVIYIVSDVRFENEVRFVQDRGGIVIRYTRRPCGDKDLHESETALDHMQDLTILTTEGKLTEPLASNDILFDFVIDNVDMNIEAQNHATDDVLDSVGLYSIYDNEGG